MGTEYGIGKYPGIILVTAALKTELLFLKGEVSCHRQNREGMGLGVLADVTFNLKAVHFGLPDIQGDKIR